MNRADLYSQKILRSIAIVKPDHIGDLVLATPAIRAVSRRFERTTLFCNSSLTDLAKRLHPAIPIIPITLSHLQKNPDSGGSSWNPAVLRDFDGVLFLRNDSMLEKMAADLNSVVEMPENAHHRHETALQQEATERMTGPYDRAALFSEQREFTFPENPHKVGLCISAGFTNNSWPAVYWLELASLLRARSIEVFLIGGPMEASLLKMLSSFLKLDANRVIQGDRQYRFLEIVRSLDLVIASDSGTAHLCSLAAPMLSIFGPSPFRRFAPFGNHNRVLTYDLKCSPCSQFHPHILNECHSRECLSLILPRHVLEALDHGLGAGPSNASAILKGGPKVFSAVGNIFS